MGEPAFERGQVRLWGYFRAASALIFAALFAALINEAEN